MFTAVVADDHSIVVEGIISILQGQDIEILKQATDGIEALEATIILKPDLLFLDLGMPKLSGKDVLTTLRTLNNTKTKTIVVTADSEPSTAVFCLLNGAKAYVLKANSIKPMREAIAAVKAGGSYIDERISEDVERLLKIKGKISERATNQEAAASYDLSEREVEILQLMAIKPDIKQETLAQNLGVSVPTLKTHLASIRDKLSVKSSDAAVEKAKRVGIIC